MEQAGPQPPAQAEQGHEAHRQQQGPDPLQEEGARQPVADQAGDAPHAADPQGRGQGHPLGEDQLPPEEQEKEAVGHHKAQGPQLEQQEKDQLTAPGPLDGSIRQNGSSDAGGGGGGVQAQEEPGAVSAPGHGRQQQEKGPQGDDHAEGDRHGTGGVQPPLGTPSLVRFPGLQGSASCGHTHPAISFLLYDCYATKIYHNEPLFASVFGPGGSSGRTCVFACSTLYTAGKIGYNVR